MLALASCNQQQNNSAQIQALNDRIRQLEDQEKQLELQSQRDKLAADQAALDAEKQRFEAEKAQSAQAAAAPAAPQSAPAEAPPESRPRGHEAPYASTVSEEDRAGSYDVFYDRLQPEGNWYEDDTYGYVWQPNVAERDDRWRPYTDGHWAYSDRGWCWVSNEDFGWATYHYGRWIRIRGRGWVWIPGNEWAPAWV